MFWAPSFNVGRGGFSPHIQQAMFQHQLYSTSQVIFDTISPDTALDSTGWEFLPSNHMVDLPGNQYPTHRCWLKVLPKEHSGHRKTLFQQYKRWLYTWTSPDGQHQNKIYYILCSWRWRSCIQSAKTRLGADCGSDHELLIAKFRLKLKNTGKTTGLPW